MSLIVVVVMVGVHYGKCSVKGDTMTSQLRVPVSVFISCVKFDIQFNTFNE